MDIQQLSQKIRSLRELNDLRQDEMADRMSISTSCYAKIEQGKRADLGIIELQKIAQIFNLDLVDLLQIDKYTVSITNNNQRDGTQYNHNYCGTQTQSELQLSLLHKDEMIEQLKQELNTLRDIISILKNKE